MGVSIEDLRKGLVVKLKPSDRARLIRRSVSTLSRLRNEGVDIPYEVDPRTGRVSYDAKDVLSELDSRQKFQNTAQYEHTGIERMEHAREAKKAVPDNA